MELYFLRHGLAQDISETRGSSDERRALTSNGIRQVKKITLGMKKIGLSFDRIFSSPYTRARETAEIVVQGIEKGKKIVVADALVPEGHFGEFSELLKGFRGDQKVLFVGHQPSLGIFISKLLSGKEAMFIDVQKGGFCRVDLPAVRKGVRGELKWLLSPQLF